MRKIQMDGWVRIGKRQARALYESGRTVFATNCKLRPGNQYVWFWLEKRPDDQYWPDHLYPTQFDYVVTTWELYNGNHEWGYYPAFYVREGKHNATHKVSIRRVYVSRGGYEIATHQYWGTGAPLYRMECTCNQKGCPLWLGETTRADNREHAKEQAKKRFDTGHVVTFFR